MTPQAPTPTPNGSPITLPPLPAPGLMMGGGDFYSADQVRKAQLEAVTADRERLAVAAPVALTIDDFHKLLRRIRAAIEASPVRQEALGGQWFNYVKQDDMLDLLDLFSAPVVGPAPAPVAVAVEPVADRTLVDLLKDSLASVQDYQSSVEFGAYDRKLIGRLKAALRYLATPAPAAAPMLSCGHPQALMLKSAETGADLYCECCDAQDRARDAETREAELQAELAALKAAPLGETGEAITDKQRLDWLDAAAVDMLLEFGFEMEGGVYLRIDAPGHGGTDIREKNSARQLIDSAMVVAPC